MSCQISDATRVGRLTCRTAESGGVRCENPKPHQDTEHWISEHTIAHALAGNGYACSAINPPPESSTGVDPMPENTQSSDSSQNDDEFFDYGSLLVDYDADRGIYRLFDIDYMMSIGEVRIDEGPGAVIELNASFLDGGNTAVLASFLSDLNSTIEDAAAEANHVGERPVDPASSTTLVNYDDGYRAGLQRARDAGFCLAARLEDVLSMTGGVLESDYARGQIDMVASTFSITAESVHERLRTMQVQALRGRR